MINITCRIDLDHSTPGVERVKLTAMAATCSMQRISPKQPRPKINRAARRHWPSWARIRQWLFDWCDWLYGVNTTVRTPSRPTKQGRTYTRAQDGGDPTTHYLFYSNHASHQQRSPRRRNHNQDIHQERSTFPKRAINAANSSSTKTQEQKN